MGETSVAADRMPLRAGDAVMDGGGRVMRVVALPPRPGGTVVCEDDGKPYDYRARFPHELVHAPSWWQGAE